jgi:hypothetical protein
MQSEVDAVAQSLAEVRRVFPGFSQIPAQQKNCTLDFVIGYKKFGHHPAFRELSEAPRESKSRVLGAAYSPVRPVGNS